MSWEVPEHELEDLYLWVDEVPLSRPKRNIARDFSDAVLAAEVVSHYCPRAVQLHNYSPANSLSQKMYNWSTFNTKVCSGKLAFVIPQAICDAAARAQPMAIERILFALRSKILEFINNTATQEEAVATRATDAVTAPADAAPAPLGVESQAGSSSKQGSDGTQELREMIDILQKKSRKLEQLVRLKDAKIAALEARLEAAGV